jgi:hypothetical protein
MDESDVSRKRHAPTSTVGRGKAFELASAPDTSEWSDGQATLYHGNSLELYERWATPTVIVSDGAYGVLGFEGDTSDHLDMPKWYEPHVAAWSRYATPQTTLWFWNSEIGWAAVHPVLEKYGWRYMNANVWNKGKAHIAGNVNTAKIRRFPVVTELCVQYSLEGRINGQSLKHWLFHEWKRTGLAMRRANDACGVKDVAVRKYLDQGHLWYIPPPAMFARMAAYANEFGNPEGRPYYSRDGLSPMTEAEWTGMRSKFHCPVGYTNVWDRNPLHGAERIRVPLQSGRAAHLNQKPLDLMSLIVGAASDPGDVVWEPFGGLFSAALAARKLSRKAYAAETDSTYFQVGLERFRKQAALF